MVRGAIREFVYDMDGPAFLKRELMGFDMYEYRYIRIHDYTNGQVPIHIF